MNQGRGLETLVADAWAIERERVGSEAIIREETKLERVFGLVTHIQFKFVQGFQPGGDEYLPSGATLFAFLFGCLNVVCTRIDMVSEIDVCNLYWIPCWYEEAWVMCGTDTPPGGALLVARRWRGQGLFCDYSDCKTEGLRERWRLAVHGWWLTCNDMSGEVYIQLLSRGDTSEVGELGSPRQDMQGLVPFVCSRLSLRQRMFGLGERSSRLGELASVAGVSVLVVASTDGSRWISLLSVSLTSLVVLGRYGLCSYLGTPPGVTEGNESSTRCISIHGSGHVIEMEEVRRAGLRAGRFVEAGPRAGRSSPFLFVYADDRVIRYTGADVDTGDAEDA
ncbi:hypothetical protein DEO72_LG8g2669 [Vigna unguiculata]|uniref:Uncharacterized protein n=1 Tax=Vigna unguiculata TaxID=3917 RepID=A0A4D6MVI1_VIGUN|nr:hypothetical protein DEO72_LG8g2669 [Vigna unguiculata]